MSLNPFAFLARRSRGAETPAAPDQAAPDQAAPVAPDAAASDQPAQTAPVRKAVIVHHGNAQAAAMFQGVMGDMDNGRFVLDERYEKVCYLFTLAGRNPSQTGLEHGTRTLEIDFASQADADQFFFNVLRSSAGQWSDMYSHASARAGSRDDVIGGMLAAEQANVATGAARLLDSCGLTRWAVPIKAECVVGQDATEAKPQTQQELMAQAPLAPLLVCMDVNEERPVIQAEQQPQPSQALLSEDAREHDGSFDLIVRGTLDVLASDAAAAERLARHMIALHQSGVFVERMAITRHEIESLTLNPRESYDDGEDEGMQRSYRY